MVALPEGNNAPGRAWLPLLAVLLALAMLPSVAQGDHYTMVPDMCAGPMHPADMPYEALPSSTWTEVSRHDGPPPAPTGLRVVEITRSTFTVTWDRTPGAAGYRLFFNGHPADRTQTRHYVAEDLHPNTPCVVQVTAYNNLGESILSEPIIVTNAWDGPAAGNVTVTARHAYGFSVLGMGLLGLGLWRRRFGR